MEEDDRDSNGFSENDQDEVMEDAEVIENDHEQGEEEDEVEEEEEAEPGPETNSHTQTIKRDEMDVSLDTASGLRHGTTEPTHSHGKELHGHAAMEPVAEGTTADSTEKSRAPDDTTTNVSPQDFATTQAASSTPLLMPRLRPRVRPEAVTAKLYDIVPTMAAPQATSINALAVTPDLRYWMTGGSDGYIRKYDGPGTINGKQLLTVAQRHPFVDSVVKAGILMSYWENEEPPAATARGAEEHLLSPVYSLAVHSRALWLLAGTEGGGINLQSVRHDEGKRITCLQRHSNAVSVLQLSPDEKSVLSGSWDKNIFDWDLNSGQIRRQFDGSGGQISGIELRPASGAPIPAFEADVEPTRSGSGTLSSSNGNPLPNGVGVNGGSATGGGDTSTSGASATISGDEPIPDHESLFGSPGGSLFGGSDAMGGNPFGDDELGTSVDMTAGSGAISEDVDGFSQEAGMMLDSGGTNVDVFAPTTFVPAADIKADTLTDTIKRETGESDRVVVTSTDTETANGPADNNIVQNAVVGGSSLSSAVAGTFPKAEPGTTTAVSSSSPRRLFLQPEQPGDESLRSLSQARLSEKEDTNTTAPTTAEDAGAGRGPAASSQTLGNQTFPKQPSAMVYSSQATSTEFDPTQVSETTFFSASIDGTIRIWDRRQSQPVARIGNRPGVPPWCMGACWSPDGNRIYAGRRNGIVEEFDIHKARAGWQPERALRFPAGSGPVSAVRAMVNGRHLVCASHDILRLYDLQDTATSKHSSVPFLIIPGPPRAGVISHLYIDQTSRYLISTAGTRGWEGTNTEVLIGYDIHSITK